MKNCDSAIVLKVVFFFELFFAIFTDVFLQWKNRGIKQQRIAQPFAHGTTPRGLSRPRVSGWWFQPSDKLVSWDDYSQYMEK